MKENKMLKKLGNKILKIEQVCKMLRGDFYTTEEIYNKLQDIKFDILEELDKTTENFKSSSKALLEVRNSVNNNLTEYPYSEENIQCDFCGVDLSIYDINYLNNEDHYKELYELEGKAKRVFNILFHFDRVCIKCKNLIESFYKLIA